MKSNNELRALVGENEKVFYEGKPDKKCFVFESIFNPLLPFAIIWALFDSLFIVGMFSASSAVEEGQGFMLFTIPFFLLHLMPVWLYIGGVLLTWIRYRNTYYIVTDKGIYASEGVLHKAYKTKPFAELSHVDLHRGIFDQMFDVGDIIVTSTQSPVVNTSDNSGQTYYPGIKINSIKNYTDVYNTIKKLQQDIYTDVMYPNDLRPEENHGYNTEYKG